MPGGALLAAFLLASLVLAATPGPGVVYIVARTLAQGRRAGLASVAGVALGNLGNVIGASLGLAALLSLGGLAFDALRFAGAAVLIGLGIRALRTPLPAMDAEAGSAPPLGKLFRDGCVVALLNPKTALFFAAFLPQFLPQFLPAGQGGPGGPAAAAGSIALGSIFVLVALCTDSVYVWAASSAARRLGHGRARGFARYASGAALIGLGVFAAASNVRPGR